MPRGVKKVLERDSDISKKIEAQINKGAKLSLIEFSVTPQDLRETYVRQQLKNNKKIDDFILNWCTGDLKKEVSISKFRNGIRVEKTILETLEPDILQFYFESRIKSYDPLIQYEIDMLNQTQIDTYIERILNDINHPGGYIKMDIFKLMNETMRLTYIMNYGLRHVDVEIQEWFDLWKKAKGRDYRIEQIFLD
jgi:hypothetical protein